MMKNEESRQAFEDVSLGVPNDAYQIIADMDPEYFEHLKGMYVDAVFGRSGALARKTKELIMVGITCAMLGTRGMRIHIERALIAGATPREVLEAIELAAIPRGMPGLWEGAQHLKEILKVRGETFR